ncbi:hypothetical protein ElyMa_003076500 [Elysia marginata]|uniref:Uncharacterized protein n=1 Tax=Elysia marginata TaxID=1093978 RepID=A0AAV4IML5_9GAST|nr:hypothetical protein ElyMa_003076500 [Elysia marginata]
MQLSRSINRETKENNYVEKKPDSACGMSRGKNRWPGQEDTVYKNYDKQQKLGPPGRKTIIARSRVAPIKGTSPDTRKHMEGSGNLPLFDFPPACRRLGKTRGGYIPALGGFLLHLWRPQRVSFDCANHTHTGLSQLGSSERGSSITID